MLQKWLAKYWGLMGFKNGCCNLVSLIVASFLINGLIPAEHFDDWKSSKFWTSSFAIGPFWSWTVYFVGLVLNCENEILKNGVVWKFESSGDQNINKKKLQKYCCYKFEWERGLKITWSLQQLWMFKWWVICLK